MKKLLKQINMMKAKLFLDEIVDHVPPVLPEVRKHKRYMHPVGARLRVMLPD